LKDKKYVKSWATGDMVRAMQPMSIECWWSHDWRHPITGSHCIRRTN